MNNNPWLFESTGFAKWHVSQIVDPERFNVTFLLQHLEALLQEQQYIESDMRKEFKADLAIFRQFFLRLPNEKPLEITPRMSIQCQKILLFVCGIYQSYTSLEEQLQSRGPNEPLQLESFKNFARFLIYKEYLERIVQFDFFQTTQLDFFRKSTKYFYRQVFSEFQDYREASGLIQKQEDLINLEIRALDQKLIMVNSYEIEKEQMGELNLFDAHDHLKALAISFQGGITSAHLISMLGRDPRLNDQMTELLRATLHRGDQRKELDHFYGVAEFQHALLLSLVRDVNQSMSRQTVLLFLNIIFQTVELEPEAKKKNYEKMISTDIKGRYYDDDDPRYLASTADTSLAQAAQAQKELALLAQGLKGTRKPPEKKPKLAVVDSSDKLHVDDKFPEADQVRQQKVKEELQNIKKIQDALRNSSVLRSKQEIEKEGEEEEEYESIVQTEEELKEKDEKSLREAILLKIKFQKRNLDIEVYKCEDALRQKSQYMHPESKFMFTRSQMNPWKYAKLFQTYPRSMISAQVMKSQL